MPNYKVKANYKGDDGQHSINDVVELDEAAATPLVEAGLIEATDEKAPEVDAPAPPLSQSVQDGPGEVAPTPPQEPKQFNPEATPNGFPQQPTQSQIDQDIASIEGSGQLPPQQPLN
jgi:hypothetical protein